MPPAEAVLDDSLADQLQTWDYRACGKHLAIANLNLQMKYGLIICIQFFFSLFIDGFNSLFLF